MDEEVFHRNYGRDVKIYHHGKRSVSQEGGKRESCTSICPMNGRVCEEDHGHDKGDSRRRKHLTSKSKQFFLQMLENKRASCSWC